MENFKEYLKRMYKARYFLVHLVRWDVKFKFRRSVLGLLWTILQPLLLTAIIAFVFSYIFKQDIKTYAPYILSGILVWDIISAAVIGNGGSFMQAESYIKQFSHPIIIYPIRAALVSIINFVIASLGLIIWTVFVYPQNIVIAVVSIPLTSIIYFVAAWSISIISSHLYVRYRDYPYVMSLVMQFLWYLSPVFFKEEMFLSNDLLHTFFLVNPITHFLLLIREPFLNGYFANAESYVYCAGVSLLLLIAAWSVNKKYEKSVIYYL
ncbi:ABC transporter permease [Anaerotignum faecicola]|nr:ABC transporter permease [Anaerotignum faecicola]